MSTDSARVDRSLVQDHVGAVHSFAASVGDSSAVITWPAVGG